MSFAAILMPLIEELPLVTGPWKHFPKLKDFLQQFGRCKEMILCVDGCEDLMFPEDFRKTLSSPILASLDSLELAIPIQNCPRFERDQEFRDSLYWMAPALELEPYVRES